MAETLEVPEKKDVEKKEAKAQGPIFGGHVAAKEGETADVLQETYTEGYTPILVKCTRGEQKAELGDRAYQITVHDEATGEDKEYVFIIPGPVIKFVQDVLPTAEPMSVAAYNEYEKKRTGRRPVAAPSVVYTKERPEGVVVAKLKAAGENAKTTAKTPTPAR